MHHEVWDGVDALAVKVFIVVAMFAMFEVEVVIKGDGERARFKSNSRTISIVANSPHFAVPRAQKTG